MALPHPDRRVLRSELSQCLDDGGIIGWCLVVLRGAAGKADAAASLPLGVAVLDDQRLNDLALLVRRPTSFRSLVLRHHAQLGKHALEASVLLLKLLELLELTGIQASILGLPLIECGVADRVLSA